MTKIFSFITLFMFSAMPSKLSIEPVKTFNKGYGEHIQFNKVTDEWVSATTGTISHFQGQDFLHTHQVVGYIGGDFCWEDNTLHGIDFELNLKTGTVKHEDKIIVQMLKEAGVDKAYDSQYHVEDAVIHHERGEGIVLLKRRPFKSKKKRDFDPPVSYILAKVHVSKKKVLSLLATSHTPIAELTADKQAYVYFDGTLKYTSWNGGAVTSIEDYTPNQEHLLLLENGMLWIGDKQGGVYTLTSSNKEKVLQAFTTVLTLCKVGEMLVFADASNKLSVWNAGELQTTKQYDYFIENIVAVKGVPNMVLVAEAYKANALHMLKIQE